MELLEQDGEPEEWKKLNVGAERRVNCEHMLALVTNLLRRHWEWQEDRTEDVVLGMHKYETACDVAQTKMVETILKYMQVQGKTKAAITSDMMDVKGSARFRKMRDRASVLTMHPTRERGGSLSSGEKMVKCVLERLEQSWQA